MFDAADLSRQLGGQAEAVCRHYLSNGRRQGRYWVVGDVHNAAGRSLYVRLKLGAAGAIPGKWTDAATGDHGDLLDLIAANRGFHTLGETLDEARRFLATPRSTGFALAAHQSSAPTGPPEAARRLFAMSRSIRGTIAQTYLRRRDLTDLRHCGALRFHPRCWYRGDPHDSRDRARDAWPALIAAITDLHGEIVGAHRTWLDLGGAGKAPISTPRRAMGRLLGNAVRFGTAADVMAAGEGLETVLSLRQVLPELPIAATLSANHLAAMTFPADLRRLYIVRDNDAAGDHAADVLSQRAAEAGIEPVTLSPVLGDFNEDLVRLGRRALAESVKDQLASADVARFGCATDEL